MTTQPVKKKYNYTATVEISFEIDGIKSYSFDGMTEEEIKQNIWSSLACDGEWFDHMQKMRVDPDIEVTEVWEDEPDD